jgi:hypothetical protein
MLASLVKGSDWSQLTEYLSPVFFQIVPPLKMAQKIKSLCGGYLAPSRFREIVERLNLALERSPLPVRIVTSQPPSDLTMPPSDTTGSGLTPGDVLLRLYFWQIFHLDEAILDLRAKAFPTARQIRDWQPSPLFTSWDRGFLAAVRNLYQGFYVGPMALMDEALIVLGLYPAKDILLKHFGADQEHVTFTLSDFRSTFHEVFVACKHAKTTMHPDFLALGGMLACLYEHLEGLGGGYNVRHAFAEVYNSR